MKAVEEALLSYEHKLFEKLFRLKHTHPPVSGVVQECLYCRMHGNVFENGVVSAMTPVSSALQEFVIPVKSLPKATR